jgi:MinD-like ATPase involved in chromosome partitioning or flagellar assembly
MEKMNLIVADADGEYIKYFTSFIRNSEFYKSVVVQSCTQIDKLEVYLGNRKGKVMLLLCSQWVSVFDQIDQVDVFVKLTETNIDTLAVDNPSVFKYQPLDELLSKLMIFYHDDHQINIKSGEQKKTKVISFFSSVGGCGKTTAAINLAIQLSSLNQKVFYLNLESISFIGQFLQVSEADEFAQLLYYAKSKPQELHVELKKLIKYDLVMKCDFIHPLKNYKDIEDIEKRDIQVIIQSLVEHHMYDVIIIDLDSTLHQRIWGVMEASDHLIWLLTDDIQCKLKTKKIMELLKSLYEMEPEKFKLKNNFTINKYTGSLMNDYENAGIHVNTFLPYIPHWKSVDQVEQLFTSDMFNRSVLKLYKNVQGVSEELIHG